MVRPSLAFIDHIFHKKTRSFDFIKTILSDRFEITEIYVDPELPVDIDFSSISAEYVVLAQVDFLTHLFISLNKKVIVVQMYDGSGWLPDEHWLLNRQARYLNFSQSLHARAVSLGCESLLLKFAPDPTKYKKQSDFESLRLFFWNRLPTSPINCDRVGRLFKGQLDACHIHLPRDDGVPPDHDVGRFFDCETTTSEWFDSKDDFESLLNSCNVFIAPRVAEGIGHSFLEAMARGMIVIAWDMPTHSEYISTWYNGILYHPETEHIELRSGPELSTMGARARFAIEQDFKEWESNKANICEFVLGCRPAVVPPSSGLMLDLARFTSAYQEGTSSYHSALRSGKFSIEIMQKWRDFEEKSDPDLTFQASQRDIFLFLGLVKSQGFELNGFSIPEGTHIWSNKATSTVRIPVYLLPSLSDNICITVEIASFDDNSLEVAVENRSLGRVALDRNYKQFTFTLPKQNIPNKGIEIEFTVEKLSRSRKGDPRTLGCKINYIRIHSALNTIETAPDPSTESTINKISRIFKFGLGG